MSSLGVKIIVEGGRVIQNDCKVEHTCLKISVEENKEKLLRDLNISDYEYISRHLIPERNSVQVKSVCQVSELSPSEFGNSTSLINLRLLNESRFINQFLIQVNKCLPDAGIFIGCVETVAQKRERVFKDGVNVFKLIYWLYCFIFHRVFPKVRFIQKVYFFFTKGRYRWLTQAETLGRLVCCGFEIIEFSYINNKLYFVVMKTSEPDFSKKASYGPFFPMSRVGKHGKMIKVYKLRTMHPYSEYLQKYVIKLNGYNEFGKPANDFRLADWGKFYRKYWLDEMPQFINVLKGELGIVGVRPLSKTRFDELPEDVRNMRIKFKPGCIPPYVALNMPDDQGNIEAERIYMEERLRNGYKTDVKYFFMAVYNILTGKIKSS